MFSFVLFFVASLILFLFFIGVIALAVFIGISLAKAKEKKNLADIEKADDEEATQA